MIMMSGRYSQYQTPSKDFKIKICIPGITFDVTKKKKYYC